MFTTAFVFSIRKSVSDDICVCVSVVCVNLCTSNYAFTDCYTLLRRGGML